MSMKNYSDRNLISITKEKNDTDLKVVGKCHFFGQDESKNVVL